MRTFGRTTAACLELGFLARSGGRYKGKLLAISHEGLMGYCSLNGYSICGLAGVTQTHMTLRIPAKVSRS